MGKPWADHGHSHKTAVLQETMKRTAEQVLYRERTTGFEPATLTLAKKRRWICSVQTAEQPLPRLFIRPLRRVGSSPQIYV